MIKTHNKTGLKYLCQTKRKNPFKYIGSGVKWKKHLDKHGREITTEIIGIYETKEELKKMGIYYSNLWNVVDSEEWANLKLEEGDGGDTSHTPGWKNGMLTRRTYKGNQNPNYGKTGTWAGKVGPMKDMTWFNNSINQILCKECPEGYTKGRIKYKCNHCDKEVNSLNKKWHFDYCNNNPNKKYRESHLTGLLWWNNGIIEKKSKESPGDDWIKGRKCVQ
jgi:hypothetical protein